MSTGDGPEKESLNTSAIKGFLAGVVFSHINKRLIIGAVAGSFIGMFVEQNIKDVPDVKEKGKEWFEVLKTAFGPK